MKRRWLLLITLPLLLFALWYWSVSSFFEDLGRADYYETISHSVPNSDQTLEIREYAGFRFSGADFYLSAPGKDPLFLGNVPTNEYTPFQKGAYHLDWSEQGVTVRYAFSGGSWEKGKEINLTWN